LAETERAGQPRWIDPQSGREIVPHGFRAAGKFWNRRTKRPPENFSVALTRLKIRLRAKQKAAGIGALRLAGFEN
jgi:hypothetical protein